MIHARLQVGNARSNKMESEVPQELSDASELDDEILSQVLDMIQDSETDYTLSQMQFNQCPAAENLGLPPAATDANFDLFDFDQDLGMPGDDDWNLDALFDSQTLRAVEQNLGLHGSDAPETKENVIKSESARFASPVKTERILELHEQMESSNTRRNTRWSSKIWTEWCQARNSRTSPDNQIGNLLSLTPSELDAALSKFVMEVRKKDGTEYSRTTLHNITCGLLRYMRENAVTDKNFMDTNDHRFDNFRKTLDARMKFLTAMGIGTEKKQADPITAADEEILWNSGQLGAANSQSLLNTVFFYNCKLFGLRAMDEHRNLECEMYTFGETSDGHRYMHFHGKNAKNVTGGLKQKKVEAKSIRHYATEPIDSERCIVSLFKRYIELIGGEGSFYRRPLGDQLKFSKQPIGVHKLASVIKDMCKKAGLSGNFTNHSGKRTCATVLYQAGVDEQAIMGRTGHRSTAVREYKRPSNDQEVELSRVLNPPSVDSKVKHVAQLKGPSQCYSGKENQSMECGAPASKLAKIESVTAGSSMYSNCTF